MPFRRRTTRRRTMRRRRPRMLRRRSLYRPRIRMNPKVHHFKRMDTAGTIAGSALDVFGGISINLNADIAGSAEFTALFDQYRINKVVLKFIPLANSSEVAGQATTLFYSALDFNDDTPVASEAEIVEYSSCKITQGLRYHTRVWTPTTLDMLTDDTGATTYIGNPKIKQWISTSAPSVPHYGLKYFRPAQPAGQLVTYKLVKIVYFSCRSVK